MATFTENYNLIKPSEEDYYDVQDFNDNIDTIDTLMAEGETKLDIISEKIGEPTTEGETIFSLLGNSENSQFIKSIQRVDYYNQETGTTLSINTVDPARCVVMMQRIYLTAGSGTPYIDYTLNSDSLEVSHGTVNYSNHSIKVAFWIIEFN